ncbi:(Fe-S)-binding protein [Taibaiella sp. KBW10]|uniref:(Fe-S)-binding protein n=1 Tax=Taibaiella sp. KBW10 TaxID=2153357 RepID=UPI001F443992|nr:(Fe-S)-binding protein [Taibaiella sp. KBW10]
MLHIIQQILFIIVLGFASFIFYKKIMSIRRNINLGKEETFGGAAGLRWKNVLLLALGQKKMFKRMTPAILHFFVYAGFLIINVEMLEIMLDGILGTHRLFAPYISSIYPILVGFFELLAFTVLVSCVIFLIRRNVLKIKRLTTGELSGGWPKTDANLILITEVVLMSLLLIMNACDYNLQQMGSEHYMQTGPFWISQYIAPLFSGLSETSLIAIERSAWWIHIVGILAFLNYLPYSKHLHIVLAFPNAYYAALEPAGKMHNMTDIQQEVLYMMEPEKAPTEVPADAAPARFGAKDVMDLSWKSLMDAYACTECGRCTTNCPANITGKKLSPRKIMMDTRDRLEEVGKNVDANKTFVEDGKALLHDYITTEELRACTSCNACVEACPVSINPLNIILELRRNLYMEEGDVPQEWMQMSTNIENNMAPWKMSPDDRDAWVHN